VATGCFISTGRSLEGAIERVKLAESLGYESVYVTHIAGRESQTAGRERAGLTLDGFDVVPAVPAAVTDSPDDAYRAMRRDLLPYFDCPSTAP